MGFFRVVGSSFGRIVGADSIKAGGNIIRNLGKRVLEQSCPFCDNGYLSKSTIEVDGVNQDFKICTSCDYRQPLSGPTEAGYELLRERLDERLAQLSNSDLQQILRQYRISFRIYLTISILAFLYAISTIFSTDGIAVIIPASGFSTLFLVLAMKSSYRHWQLQTRTFFQAGSFKTWWNSGNWII